MKLSFDLLKKNIYWVISLVMMGLVLIFSMVMLITLEVGAEADHTSLGFIFLGNVEEEDYDQTIYQGINTWKAQAQYSLFYQEYHIDIDMDLFDFDMDQTKDDLVKNDDNEAYFTLNETHKTALIHQLSTMLGSVVMNGFNQELFFQDLIDDAKTLSRVKNYLISEYLDLETTHIVIDTKTIDTIDALDVTEILNAFTTITIKGQSRFSLLETLTTYNLTNEQLSMVASGILGVIDQSHMTAIDFDIYPTMPSWATIGQNVRILRLNESDLSFYNGLRDDYTIEISAMSPTSLRFELIGLPYVTLYESELITKEVIPYRQIIVDDDTIDALTPGVLVTETDTTFIYELVVQIGVDGYIYTKERTTTPYQSTSVVSIIYHEQYLPVDEIIHRHVINKGG